MLFRNLKNIIPQEVSSCDIVSLVGDDFKIDNLNKNLPSSSDYSLKDMLVAGVKVPLVNPTVIHDSAATSVVADTFVQSQNVNVDNNND